MAGKAISSISSAPGVDGSIEVSNDIIHVQARLGLLLMFLHGRIQDEIRNYLESHFDCEIDA